MTTAPSRALLAWASVFLLCLAQILSTIDRGMLSLVIDPVKADLGISDVQIATLQGFAFAIFYVSVGIPLGFVADAVNRRLLLVGGMVLWSAATLASGFAQTFGHMFMARLGIGVGEAVLGPCAVGIISELFPAERRGRPMALYVLGSMIAYGIGSAVTGIILAAVPTGALDWLPLPAGFQPWQYAFVLVGLAGLPLASLLFLVPEQGNRRPAPCPTGERAGPRWQALFSEAVAEFRRRGRYFASIYGAAALFASGGAVATGWSAVMLSREFGMDPATVGKSLGAWQIGWAVCGAVTGGFLVDRIGRRRGTEGKLILAGLATIATLPSAVASFMPTPFAAQVLAASVMGTSALFGTTMLSVIAETVPTRSRGVGVAFYAFVMTMIGGSLSPLAVAGLTERVFASSHAVGKSMFIVGLVTLGGGSLVCLVAARSLAAAPAPAHPDLQPFNA